MFKKDLAITNIEYENEYGKADFHELRHNFCSMLARKNVLLQTAQRLMRHSDVNSTMQAYTHILLKYKQNDIASLPKFNT